MKSEEENDPLEKFIRHSIGNEPLLPSPMNGDGPAQWTQLLDVVDQPDVPGGPVLTPVKVGMQRCDNCPSRFYSSVNYRRHIRVHRLRSLNTDHKEFHKNKDILAAFWDKLSLEKVKDIISVNDVKLKGSPGSSVIEALASSLLKTEVVYALPPGYTNAGSFLLEFILGQPLRLPIPSCVLFCVLDDASERTFLCGGPPESVQDYVFDGEIARNILDLKNLVASTSFLVENRLVKAWVADKDAESLRLQKLLEEEEEAERKRQAGLSEKKRQKKLRQKEKKLKNQLPGNSRDLDIPVDEIDPPPHLAEGSVVPSTSLTDLSSLNVPENRQLVEPEGDHNHQAQRNVSSQTINQGDSETIEPQGQNYEGQNRQTFNKPETIHKLDLPKDRTLQSGAKKKLKVRGKTKSLKPPALPVESGEQIEDTKSQVIFGAIPITKTSVAQPDEAHERCSTSEKLITADGVSNEDSEEVHDEAMDNRCDEYVLQGSLPFFDTAAGKEFPENHEIDPPPLAEGSGVPSMSLTDLSSLNVPENHQSEPEEDHNHQAQRVFSNQPINQADSETIEPQGQLTVNRSHVSVSQRGGRYGFREGQNHQKINEPKPVHKPVLPKDRTLQSGAEMKPKVLSDTESLKPTALQVEPSKQIEEIKSEVMMVGAIPITIETSVAMFQKKNTSEKLIAADATQSLSNGETKTFSRADDRVNNNEDSEEVHDDKVSSEEENAESESMDNSFDENVARGSLPFFDAAAAKEFLAKRWAEAISGDYEVYVSSADDQNISSASSHVHPYFHVNQADRTVHIKYSRGPKGC